jgi:hypothetical protein
VAGSVTLAPGQTVTFVATGNVTPTLRGDPKNCAGVVGYPVNEQNYANNTHCIRIPPPNRGQPKLTIVKDPPKSCRRQGPDYLCDFTITVTNDGTAPASGGSFTDTPTAPGRIVDVEPGDSATLSQWRCPLVSGSSSITCTQLADMPPGSRATIHVGVSFPASGGSVVENCVKMGGVATPNGGLLSSGPAGLNNSLLQGQQGQPTLGAPGINPSSPAGQTLSDAVEGQSSCKSVQVGSTPPAGQSCTPEAFAAGASVINGQCVFTFPVCRGRDCPQLCADGKPRNSDGNCPTPTTTTCPVGTRRGLDGQCFFVDPACRGSDCPPVTSGCADGQLRNSEGNCPTPVPRLCANRQPRNSDGSCPTTTTSCSNPTDQLVNGACCNIRDYNAGNCGGRPTTTTTGCPGGAQRVDGQCPTTTGGCKTGQFRGDDGTCQNKPTKPTSRCGRNETWNGETCAKDTKKKKEGKEKQKSESNNNNRLSRANRTKEIKPSQLQSGSTQQFQRGPSSPINSLRKR